MRVRVVEPEILDTLPPDDPRALANRRDLRLLNRIMGNAPWAASALRHHLQPGDHILEAGAGEGDLGRYLRPRVPLLRQCRYTGLDLGRDRPADWPAAWDWRRADLLAHDFVSAPQVLLINFLLHQFRDEDLVRLGRAIRDIPVWIVCEPHRSVFALAGLALLRPLGLHDVSWHDGRISVRAGFRGRELAGLLGADAGGRRTTIAVDPRGSYRLVSVSPRDTRIAGRGGRSSPPLRIFNTLPCQASERFSRTVLWCV